MRRSPPRPPRRARTPSEEQLDSCTTYQRNASWFLDGSSTALLASTVYRFAALQSVYTHIPNAEAARAALSAPSGSDTSYTSWGTGDGVGPETSFTQTTSTSARPSGTSSSYAVPTPTGGGEGLSHFSPEMWLTPVVDPYDWSAQGGSSPRGPGIRRRAVCGMA